MSTDADLEIILAQARQLRSQVAADLTAQSFLSDDVRMSTYNQLLLSSLQACPSDPILGQLPAMPDGNLKSYPLLGFQMPNSLPSQRLQDRLTQLINRLEFLTNRGKAVNNDQAPRPTHGPASGFAERDPSQGYISARPLVFKVPPKQERASNQCGILMPYSPVFDETYREHIL